MATQAPHFRDEIKKGSQHQAVYRTIPKERWREDHVYKFL